MTFDIAPITRLLDGMVHASVASDRLLALRHRKFIAAHLFAGLLALSAIPIWLAAAGPTSVSAALTFSWLLAPLAVAIYLSRTGRLDVAYFASAVASVGFVVWLAGFSGGVKSPALAWLVLIPVSASLSGTSRNVAVAAVVSVLGVTGLMLAGAFGLPLPVSAIETNAYFQVGAVVVAIIGAAGLAAGADRLAQGNAKSARRDAASLRFVLDNAGDLITRHAANGDVEYVSPSVQALTGASVAETLGDGLFCQVHPHDRPVYLKVLSEACVGAGPMTAEFRLRQRDGDGDAGSVPVEMRCRPILGGGSGGAVVAVTREISKSRAHETKLQQACLSAEQASQARMQHLAQWSHEVRTPLNAIIGFSEFLESNLVDERTAARRRDYARLIRLSGEHLLQLVDTILDTSKFESSSFDITREKIQIGPLIAECCDMLGRQADARGVSLECTSPDGVPEIAADARACRQILINLLSNAIKFSDRGGVVTVGARLDGESVALFVRDNGIGISAEDLPRLGTPFVQVEPTDGRAKEGTGLGLSMVKRLAALHGGRLEIESTPAVGTTATAILPVNDVPVRPANAPGLPPGSNDEERKSA